jgi:hypothetical protein
MLQNLDQQIRDCLQRAADCAERAKAATNERDRKDWLDVEASYLRLAHSVEFARRAERFSNEVARTLYHRNSNCSRSLP